MMHHFPLFLFFISVYVAYASVEHHHEQVHHHVERNYHNEEIRLNEHHRNVRYSGQHEESRTNNQHKEQAKNEHQHHKVRHHNHRHGNFHSKHGQARCTGGSCDPHNTTDTGSEGGPYTLYYNSAASLLALSSASSQVSLVIDYSTGTTVSLDGKNAQSVIISPESNLALLLDKSSPLVWTASNQPFETFFASLDSSALKAALQPGNQNGNATSIHDASQEVQKVLANVLTNLGQKDLADSSISSIQKISSRITNEKSIINVLVSGSGKAPTHLRLTELICVLEGIGKIITNLESNGQQIPKLDLSRILLAHSGFEAFLNILKQLSGHTDLSKVIGNGLYTVENFLSFGAKFSGDSSNGVDGIIRILNSIVGSVSNHASGSDIIQSFIQFFINDGINFDRRQIVGIIRSAIAIFQAQSRLFPNVPGSNILINFLENLEHGDLIFKSINISAIFNSFVHLKPQNALKAIICIFTQLGIGIPELFLRLLGLLTTPSGVDGLTRIIPGIDKNQIPISGRGNPLQALLANANLPQVISSGCPITRALQGVPILGSIFSAVSNAASAAGGTTDFTKFFSPSSPGLSSFLNFLHGFGGNGSGINFLNGFGGNGGGLNFLNGIGGNGGGLSGLLNTAGPVQSGLGNILGGSETTTTTTPQPSPIGPITPTGIPIVDETITPFTTTTTTQNPAALFTDAPIANGSNSGLLGTLFGGRNNKPIAKNLRKENH